MRKKHYLRNCLRFEQFERRELLDANGLTGDFLDRPDPIAGDANRDGAVDFGDFLIVTRSFGQTGTTWDTGDLSGDAQTDFSDFLIIAREFGNVAPTLDELQTKSVEDREITSKGFEEFKAATAIPSVSPKLVEATDSDLVVRYDEMLHADGLTAVVLKPRINGLVHQVAVPPADANVFDFLKDEFKQALRDGAGTVLFPENHTFTIVPPLPTARHLKLEGFQDTVIDLNGSTLEFTQVSRGILIEDSQRLAIRNGSIRGFGILASIAQVVPDDSVSGIGFELLPEYREQITSSGQIPDIVTIGPAEMGPEGWRIQQDEFREIFANRGGARDNFAYDTLLGRVRSTSPLSDSDAFEIGDHVWILHENNAGHGIFLDNETGAGVEDISLEQLQISNIPGMQIVGEVIRGLHVDEVRIEVDTNQPLAFLASSSDSIHINANGGDIVIENSVLGPNLDDKINVKGNYWQITEIDPTINQLKVEPVDRNTSLTRWGSQDQRVVFIEGDFDVIGSAHLVEDSIRDSSKRHFIRLDAIPEGVELGTIIGNVDNAGGRIVIRNNVMAETRAQGVLVQTSHVVVENNSFTGIVGPAIRFNLALHKWYEAINVSNVLIKDNQFSRSSRSLNKSNELITLFQIDQCLHRVEVIDGVRIVGNRITDLEDSTVDVDPDSSDVDQDASSESETPSDGDAGRSLRPPLLP